MCRLVGLTTSHRACCPPIAGIQARAALAYGGRLRVRCTLDTEARP
jgi:hypothetical protein